MEMQGDIGWAVLMMKGGYKVRRAGWNGKGMFIVCMPRLQLPPRSSQAPEAKVNDRTAKHIGEDAWLNSQSYIALCTSIAEDDGARFANWQPGWVCSQADLLAEDWELVD